MCVCLWLCVAVGRLVFSFFPYTLPSSFLTPPSLFCGLVSPPDFLVLLLPPALGLKLPLDPQNALWGPHLWALELIRPLVLLTLLVLSPCFSEVLSKIKTQVHEVFF